MPYLQCSVDLDAADVAALEQAWEALGALSITYSDPGGEPVLEPPVGTNPLWPELRLTALFDPQVAVAAVQEAAAQVLHGALPGWKAEVLEDRAWERTWMDDFQAMRFGRRLWVVPSNLEPPEPDAVNLRLDPGLAFGTGTHPTTALCLEWLDEQALQGREVVDYGCGSGILSVAALLLGARGCLGIDNDPQALTASRDNAERNGVLERLALALPEQAPTRQADVLVANILANILIDLAPRLADQVRPGGAVALSGILVEQAAAVAEAFRPWFELEPPRQREDWVLLFGRRR